MTVVTGTIETDFKVTEQERLEFKALHKLHETQDFLETAIRGLHTFLTSKVSHSL